MAKVSTLDASGNTHARFADVLLQLTHVTILLENTHKGRK